MVFQQLPSPPPPHRKSHYMRCCSLCDWPSTDRTTKSITRPVVTTTHPIPYNNLCPPIIQLLSKLTAKSRTSSSSMSVSRVHLVNHCYFFTSRANRTATPPTLPMLTLAPSAQNHTSFFFTSMPAHSNTSRRSCVRLAASACIIDVAYRQKSCCGDGIGYKCDVY